MSCDRPRYTYTLPSVPISFSREPRWMRFLMSASLTPSLATASLIVTLSVPVSCPVSTYVSSTSTLASHRDQVTNLRRSSQRKQDVGERCIASAYMFWFLPPVTQGEDIRDGHEDEGTGRASGRQVVPASRLQAGARCRRVALAQGRRLGDGHVQRQGRDSFGGGEDRRGGLQDARQELRLTHPEVAHLPLWPEGGVRRERIRGIRGSIRLVKPGKVSGVTLRTNRRLRWLFLCSLSLRRYGLGPRVKPLPGPVQALRGASSEALAGC